MDFSCFGFSFGTKSPLRRQLHDSLSVPGRELSWQWQDDHDSWNTYDVDVNNYIDTAFCENKKSIKLSEKFPGWNYEIVFTKMIQINMYTKQKRKIRRFDNSSTQDEIESHASMQSSSQNNSTALVDGKPWYDFRPPHTPQSLLKPVPGIDPLPKLEKPEEQIHENGAVASCPDEIVNVWEKYTEIVDSSLVSGDEPCNICLESLSSASPYNDDTMVSKLILCSHIFHKACIEAMYNSRNKEFLQCPYCKQIHGERCGTQPPGEMIYHILPYSLPGYPENDTIRIIYDIHGGVQGPEHPNPGSRYSARHFPRHCFLPDNEIGRKILRLLVKAWKRRLIFTIGRSSTTGEENTVTWTDIHHKTEFGCNRRGHGYPDPDFFSNVIFALEANGVTDDEVSV